MSKFTVEDIRKIPSAEDGRVGKMDHLITYKLDPFRIYMVTIPKADITEADIVEAVRSDLEKIEQFRGKELST